MRRDVLRELGVDDLVDHDPRRDHPVAERDPHDDRDGDDPVPATTQAGTATARGRRGRRRVGRDRHTRPASRATPDDLLRVVDADLGRGLGDPRAAPRRRGLAAGGLLERGGVGVGDAAEVVLGRDVRARRRAELGRVRRPRARAPPRSSAPRTRRPGSSARRRRAARRTSRRRRRASACRARARGSPTPDVSPIVGERRLTSTSQAAISDLEPLLAARSCSRISASP